MKLVKVLRYNSEPSHWVDGLLWLGWALVCGLLPLWATIVFLDLYSQPVALSGLTHDGAFFIYSASYLGGCLYTVIKDFKRRGFPNKGLLSLLMVVLLLISALAFAQITVSNLLSSVGIPQPLSLLNRHSITIYSWVVLPVVLIVSYLITVTENVRISVNLTGSKEKELADLNRTFDQLEDTRND